MFWVWFRNSCDLIETHNQATDDLVTALAMHHIYRPNRDKWFLKLTRSIKKFSSF